MDNIKRNAFFDWCRLFFAALVMLSHSLVLKTGNGGDWLANSLGGETFGSVGVKGFFILSGYFVLPSLLLSGSSAKHYVLSRLFRIFPGLIMCVFICIILGSFLSPVPASEYWSSRDVWQFLFYNGLGIEPRYSLPGVFSSNPWPNSVNGSLWTLPLEIRCYLLLLVFWFLGFFKDIKISALALLIVFVSGVSGSAWVSHVFGNPDAGSYIACFALGALYRLYGWDQKLSLISISIAAICLGFFWSSPIHHLVFGLAFAAFIFFTSRLGLVKYIPELPEDISFGVYLYAFPIQQTIVFLKPEWPLSMQLLTSFLLVLVIAYITRILIEKPTLRFKDSILKRTQT